MFSAAIRSGTDGSTVRRLQAEEASCAALAHATAVALALLYDSDLGGAGDAPAPAKPPEISRPPVVPPRAPPGLKLGNFRASLGALWVPPADAVLSPGSVHEDLLSGTLRACDVAWRSTVMRLDLCSGALVGAPFAGARGFTVNERDTQSFLAFPVEAALALRTGIVGWARSRCASCSSR